MAPIANFFAFFTLILSVTALTIPNSHNIFKHRRAVAHAGIQLDTAVPVVAPKVKRSLNKRCVPMSSGNSTTSTSSSSFSYTSSLSPSSSYSSVAPSSTTPPVNVAPSPVLPSSSSTHTPTPTPTPTPSSSSSSSTPVQTTSASSSGSSTSPSYLVGTQSGQGTYYETGLGACGITNSDTDYIAAVSELLFDTYPNYNGVNPNDNPVCNKKVTASYGGKSVTVAITDRCTGCAITDLDFSPSAFSALADQSLGRIDITWKWD